MLTMNRATVLGYAGRNPEMRRLPSGDEVALLSLATNERFKRRDGTEGEVTDWHAVVAFGTAAETVRKRVRKGDPVLVEGRISTRVWTDPEGRGATHHRDRGVGAARARERAGAAQAGTGRRFAARRSGRGEAGGGGAHGCSRGRRRRGRRAGSGRRLVCRGSRLARDFRGRCCGACRCRHGTGRQCRCLGRRRGCNGQRSFERNRRGYRGCEAFG